MRDEGWGEVVKVSHGEDLVLLRVNWGACFYITCVLPEYMAGCRRCHKARSASSDLIFNNFFLKIFPPSEANTSNWKKKKMHFWMKQCFRFNHPVITQEGTGHPNIKASSFERENVSLLHISGQIEKNARCVFETSYWGHCPEISKRFLSHYTFKCLLTTNAALLYKSKLNTK